MVRQRIVAHAVTVLSKMDPPTEIEREAVLLRYRAQHPYADDQPTAELAAQLLTEVRNRQQQVEQAALDILRRETRNPPSRGFYSKHMQFFILKVLFPLIIIGLGIVAVNWLIKTIF